MNAVLGRSAAHTDPGRRRRRNEDAFVHLPPLFAVCDGMGGALAGELASRLAATALEEAFHHSTGAAPGAAGAAAEAAPLDLVAAILEGNRRIRERSLADPATSGMGTTVTAVVVGEDGSLRIGHVGDSRAYRLRAGALEQLTPDHSLVAELVRTGQITPEEAEGHPQRAVITRALGTDANVEVDVFHVQAEPGDLYLLCSDGLTVMIDDGQVRAILEREAGASGDLARAARALVAAANAAGGEDNITCVVFETVAPPTAAAAAGGDAAAGSAAEQTGVIPVADEDTLGGLDTSAEQTMILPAPQAATGWAAEPQETAAATAPSPAAAPARGPLPPAEPPRPAARPRRRGRRATILVLLVVLLAAAAAAGVVYVSRAHFVGADSRGRLVVYQGVPWDIASRVRLYRAVYVSPVLAFQLSQPERIRLFDHGLHSKTVAVAAVRAYERELLR